MARRAIRLAVEEELSVGPALSSFILSQAAFSHFEGIYIAFVNGLRRHVEHAPVRPFLFRPQRSIDLHEH